MSKTAPATLVCEICKRTKSPHDGMIAELIRPSLLEFIKKRMPDWDGKGFICLDDLGKFRKEYVKDVLVVWIILNAALLLNRGFDPYPFILLNLILSCLAAMQAPIIMMSQNRAELRDRLRSENDYKINLKAELEIRHLHEKIDHLLRRHYNRLFEIQQIQIELLEEISRQKK